MNLSFRFLALGLVSTGALAMTVANAAEPKSKRQVDRAKPVAGSRAKLRDARLGPNGSLGGNGRIAYAINPNIHTVPAGGGEGEPFVLGFPQAPVADPEWRPGGGTLLFTYRDHESATSIYTTSAYPGKNKVRGATNGTHYGSPSGSPDGSRIVASLNKMWSFGNLTSSTDLELVVMNSDGSGETRITRSKGYDFSPAWSPTGDRIAFVGRRNGDDEIYTVRPDGSDLERLTHHQGMDGSPHWSPNGQKIVFSRSGAAPQTQVWVMFSDGTGAQPLTHGHEPTWSPDGRKILFRRAHPTPGLFVIDAGGAGRATRIVSGHGSSPSWERVQPYIDGKPRRVQPLERKQPKLREELPRRRR